MLAPSASCLSPPAALLLRQRGLLSTALAQLLRPTAPRCFVSSLYPLCLFRVVSGHECPPDCCYHADSRDDSDVGSAKSFAAQSGCWRWHTAAWGARALRSDVTVSPSHVCTVWMELARKGSNRIGDSSCMYMRLFV
jgi:hypothetical protein